MSKLSLAQLVDLATRHAFPDPHLAAAVAMAESGGDPAIIGDTQPGVLGPSVGLWQIDLYFHPTYTQAQLVDQDANASAAFAISQGGKSWAQWSTAWEDPVHHVGYLGPKSPVRKYWTPPPGVSTGSITGTVLATFILAGVTYAIVRSQ